MDDRERDALAAIERRLGHDDPELATALREWRHRQARRRVHWPSWLLLTGGLVMVTVALVLGAMALVIEGVVVALAGLGWNGWQRRRHRRPTSLRRPGRPGRTDAPRE